MAATTEDFTPTIALDGSRKVRGSLTQARIRWVILALLIGFAVVCARLVQLGMVVPDQTIEGQARDVITATRPPILDRNGLEMAVDIRVPSMYAEPRRIIDVDEAVSKILTVLPSLDPKWLRDKLSGDRGFIWIQREMSPAQQDKIMRLGLPGIDFITESKRFYPGMHEASHILGSVNIDNQGIAGIEKHIDQDSVALLQDLGLARGNDLTPVQLSIDMRVQHVIDEELQSALVRYKAIAAAGVVMDIYTGEIIGLASLPDFDPNDPKSALVKDSFNRITAGIYELGSTFKTITIAGAIDSGAVSINDTFDARYGIRFGRYTIDDFHGKHRILSVPEIYKYSSNIGTIRVMQAMGKEAYRAFLTKMGLDSRVPFELPEMRLPSVPKNPSEVSAATMSFGHGLSVSPLHMAVAMAAITNGGNYIAPTLYRRTLEEAQSEYVRVIKPETSRDMRYLMRLNALEGSGSLTEKIAKGYRVGGKTGTAEKVENGVYSHSKDFNVFAAAFPMDEPKYALVVVVDEPQLEQGGLGTNSAYNAGMMSGRIVQRIAPMLGIAPNFSPALDDAMIPPDLNR